MEKGEFKMVELLIDVVSSIDTILVMSEYCFMMLVSLPRQDHWLNAQFVKVNLFQDSFRLSDCHFP